LSTPSRAGRRQPRAPRGGFREGLAIEPVWRFGVWVRGWLSPHGRRSFSCIHTPRRPSWGILARLRARKEAGVSTVGEKTPALIKALEINARCRPRNICIITCPPCTEIRCNPIYPPHRSLPRSPLLRAVCAREIYRQPVYDSGPIGPGLSRILDMDCRELFFSDSR
jgi:hypothetical protein